MTTDLFTQGGGGGYGDTYKSSKPRCHTTHKPIKLGNGEIVGAACGSPREGYDIYIGFDYGMKYQHQQYPWDLSPHDDPVIEFEYHITDMCAPKSPKEFRKMIDWCADQLDNGKKIHIGCIGGHGRTGTFLAALISLYEDLTDDPIAYVREHHCKKAVESKTQVKFLMKHFGCKKAKATKQKYSGTVTGRISGKGVGNMNHAEYEQYQYKGGNVSNFPRSATSEKIRCMSKKGSIWG